MARRRGVRPEQDRLDLSDGDWVDVKRRLTVGESRDIVNLGMTRVSRDMDEAVVSPDLPFMAAATYILNWSLLDYDGNPIPWPADEPVSARVAVLRGLDRETMLEIENALEVHRIHQMPKKPAAEATMTATPPPAPEPPTSETASAESAS